MHEKRTPPAGPDTVPPRRRFGKGPPGTLPTVSTRVLILLSLLCGLAILVAFAVQVLIAR